MKRKTLFFLLGLLFLVPLSLRAYDFKSGDLYYNITSNIVPYTVEVTYEKWSSSYAGLTTIVIPEMVIYNDTTYGVTSIGNSAFSACSGLTSITIPNSVTSIGNFVFQNCSALTSLTIPNSVTSIGNSAFVGCNNLTDIIIPNSVTSIGNFAFRDTPWYNNQPDGVLYIGKVLYKYKGMMHADVSISVKDGTTQICDNAFSGCSGLTSITIPNSVTSIGNMSFFGCSGLMSVTIPNSVTSIGYEAFCNCKGLTSIIIPNSVTSIGNMSFCDCSGLMSVTIPNSVTSIGENAFSGVVNIMYDGIATGSPWGALSVNGYVEGNFVYEDITKKKLLGCNCGLQGEIVIPNSVTSIGKFAFSNCIGITSITIPNSVVTIGLSAFVGCSALTSITIPNSVTSIENNAFINCSSLTSIIVARGNSVYDSRSNCNAIIETATNTLITGCPYSLIPEDVVCIGESAFRKCTGLTSIVIPNSVTSMGSGAFNGCTGLTSITIPENVTSIGNIAFYGCSNLTSVVWNARHYNEEAYQSSLFGNIQSQITSFTIGDKVEYVPRNLCFRMNNLTTITIPESVVSIGNGAFRDCSNLASITIGSGVTTIGDCAFENCSALSVTIPDGVTSIGKDAFKGVLNVIYHGSATGSPWGAQYVNYYVEGDLIFESEAKNHILRCLPQVTGEIVIPESVTSIGRSAFSGCSGLTSITIPKSVTRIEDYAFSDCGITNICLPKNLSSIGSYILSGCPIKDIIAQMETPVYIRDNMIGGSQSTQNIPLFVSSNSVARYQAASYWSEYDVQSQGFVIHATTTTQATASADATYITFDSLGHSRLGYIFAGDTIWNSDVSSDSVSFKISGLAPSTDYDLCFIADSVFANGGIVVSDSCNGTQWSEWSSSDAKWTSDDGCYYLSDDIGFYYGVSDFLYRTITLEKGVEYTFSIDIDNFYYRYIGAAFSLSLGNDGQYTTLLNVSSLNASYTTYSATFTPTETKEYTLQIYAKTARDGRLRVRNILVRRDPCCNRCLSFQTQPVNCNVNVNNTTQTTVALHLPYDLGDADIDSLLCMVACDADTVPYSLYINEQQGEIDTVLTHLHPGTNYKAFICTMQDGAIVGKTISTTFTTLPIVMNAPSISEYGQTYAVINCDYDYGDATVLRNVLEFRLSAEDDADVVVAENVTSAQTQTKVTNLLPDTTYYFRHVLEFEGVGLLVSPIRTNVYTFESTEDNVHWHFINGEESNKWIIDTSAGSNGTGGKALYVSDGTSYSYTNTTSSVWAYCDEILEGIATVSFDWKGTGESSYDYMYAYLVPVSASQPIAGSTTIPTGAIQIGSRFNGQSSWITFTDQERTLTGQYRLYFMWHNDDDTNRSPIAIDNIAINIQSGKPGWQEFTTKPIMLTTQFADGLSNTSALLHGTVDCDQESYTEVGFEWKRSDAPATVQPQRLLVTDRVDENLLFRLEGLSSDHYYDFRTFCSYQGKTYYGEWVGFLTSDKEVLVAPTVQTVGATANEQGAEMEGFIVAGTEPVLQKGFEVWIKGGTDVKTTVAEGHIIRALIPEPWSYTTYRYKAYAKTASGTTYGETMEITTGYIPRDVQDIVVTPSSNSAEVTWTKIEVADYYILTLFADEAMTDTIAVYQVGTNGSINRLRMPSAVKALVTCSISDLVPVTDYYFAVVAYNSANQKVAEENGTFATTSETSAIFQPSTEQLPSVRKVLYNGQVFILRGNEVYTVLGEKVE